MQGEPGRTVPSTIPRARNRLLTPFWRRHSRRYLALSPRMTAWEAAWRWWNPRWRPHGRFWSTNLVRWGPKASTDVVNGGDTWAAPVTEKSHTVLNAVDVDFSIDVDNTCWNNDRFLRGSVRPLSSVREPRNVRATGRSSPDCANNSDSPTYLARPTGVSRRTRRHPDLLACSEFPARIYFAARLFPARHSCGWRT